MRKVLLFIVCMCSIARAEDCPCDIYPFKPNPPCYDQCVKFLVKNKEFKLSNISNMDPGVAVSISALRNVGSKNFENIGSITNKERLETEAAKIIPDQGEWRLFDREGLSPTSTWSPLYEEKNPSVDQKDSINPSCSGTR